MQTLHCSCTGSGSAPRRCMMGACTWWQAQSWLSWRILSDSSHARRSWGAAWVLQTDLLWLPAFHLLTLSSDPPLVCTLNDPGERLRHELSWNLSWPAAYQVIVRDPASVHSVLRLRQGRQAAWRRLRAWDRRSEGSRGAKAWNDQHGFTTDKLCLACLMAFCIGVAGSVHKERLVVVVHLGFYQSFWRNLLYYPSSCLLPHEEWWQE